MTDQTKTKFICNEMENKNYKFLGELISKVGVNHFFKKENGFGDSYTLLGLACEKKLDEVLKYIVHQKRVDLYKGYQRIQGKNYRRETPLFLAVKNENLFAVSLLLENEKVNPKKGGVVKENNSKESISPLFLSLRNCLGKSYIDDWKSFTILQKILSKKNSISGISTQQKQDNASLILKELEADPDSIIAEDAHEISDGAKALLYLRTSLSQPLFISNFEYLAEILKKKQDLEETKKMITDYRHRLIFFLSSSCFNSPLFDYFQKSQIFSRFLDLVEVVEPEKKDTTVFDFKNSEEIYSQRKKQKTSFSNLKKRFKTKIRLFNRKKIIFQRKNKQFQLIYQGQVNENGLKDGFGTVYRNGIILYNGEFKKDTCIYYSLKSLSGPYLQGKEINFNDPKICELISRIGKTKLYKYKIKGKLYAVKLFPSSVPDLEIKKNIMMMFPLNNKNVVKSFFWSLTKPKRGIAFDLCKDSALTHIENKSVGFLEKVNLLCKTANGIKYLHRHHLSHGKLNWESVLFVGNLPKIINLQPSTVISEEISEELLELPYFVAPEIIRDLRKKKKTVKTREADVFAFGVMMYQILFNKSYKDLDDLFYNKKEIKEYFKDEKKTPSILQDPPCTPLISESWITEENTDLVDLLENCLNSNPLERKSFETISRVLDDWIKHRLDIDSDSTDTNSVENKSHFQLDNLVSEENFNDDYVFGFT